MKYYTIGIEKNITYGHGDFGNEVHICPKNPYMGDESFHPLFPTVEGLKEYMETLEFKSGLCIVELETI